MPAQTCNFDYDTAFDRNIGWFTMPEQQFLRRRRIAIGGCGGVGGVYLLTLARMGIGGFSLADFDTFDLANFNRQVGATIHTIGRPKIAVMEEMARAINPELDITRLDRGVEPHTIDDFLHGADLFVDGFDFFALDIRRAVHAAARARGIPAIVAAPIGMGTGFLVFQPDGMSFEQYFRMAGHDRQEQALRFLAGMVPRGLHRSYLVDPSRFDLAAQRGPSVGASCELCAGVVGITAAKLLLGRGPVLAAPVHQHFDVYTARYVTTMLRWGNDGPLQRLRLAALRRGFARAAGRGRAPGRVEAVA